MKTFRHRLAGVAALAATAGTLTMATPAHAVDGPQARDDVHLQNGRDPVTINVLDNDSWDPTRTATVTNVAVKDVRAYDIGYAGPDQSWLPDLSLNGGMVLDDATFDVDWTPDGKITVDFGPASNIPAFVHGTPVGVSAVRYATVTYRLLDSWGQYSDAVALIGDRNAADVPLMARQDPAGDRLAWRLGEPATGWDWTSWREVPGLSLLANDDFHDVGDLRIEVVGSSEDLDVRLNGPSSIQVRPVEGAVTESYMTDVDGELRAERTGSYSYRICDDVRGTCSAPVVNDVPYFISGPLTETPDEPVKRSPLTFRAQTLMSWQGMPKNEVVTIDELINAENLPGYVPDWMFTYDEIRSWMEADDVTYTTEGFAKREGAERFRLEPTSMGWERASVALAKTSTGEQVGQIDFTLSDMTLRGSLVDDEAWVAVEQGVGVPLELNDDLQVPNIPSFPNATEARWFGTEDTVNGSSQEGKVEVEGEMRFGENYKYSDPSEVIDRFGYFAGDVTGKEVLTQKHCLTKDESLLPTTDGLCSTAKLTVHVSPLNVAQDDDGATMPAKPVTVPVLANDVFTDTPFLRSRVEILGDTVPADVEVEVNEAREVVVIAPARYTGETVEFGYRLTDFTRSSTATVRVEVGEPAVIIPEPTPPVTPKPEPTPPATPTPEPKPLVKPKPVEGPKAKADRSHTMVDLPATISVLKNDRFTGKAQVMLTGVPKGVKAVVTKGGKVKVTAGQR